MLNLITRLSNKKEKGYIMSKVTTYTTTITVPVYGSWRCEHCGEVNFSTGTVKCTCQDNTVSIRNSKHKEVKEKVASTAITQWTGHAYKIIMHPKSDAKDTYDSLLLENTRCKKCGKKPSWNKSYMYGIWGGICFLLAIINGYLTIGEVIRGEINILSLLITIFALIGAVSAFFIGRHFSTMMSRIPDKYTPVLGSLNPELINYAKQFDKVIPTPDETIDIVRNNEVLTTTIDNN